MSWKSTEIELTEENSHTAPLPPPPLSYLDLISRGHQGPCDNTALLALKLPPPLCYKAGNFLQHDKQEVFTAENFTIYTKLLIAFSILFVGVTLDTDRFWKRLLYVTRSHPRFVTTLHSSTCSHKIVVFGWCNKSLPVLHQQEVIS